MHIDRVRGHSFVGTWISTESRVVDLGMNEGSFARELELRYGCRALGVEANPILAEKLRHDGNMDCFNYAIAQKAGTLDFYIDLDNSEASSVTRVRSDRVRQVQVPGITLGEFLERHNVGVVDLLKVDIEGAEIDLFLKTDPAAFAKIVQICIEFHIFLFEEHRPKVKEALERMSKMGFFCLDLSRDYEDTLLINQNLKPLRQLDKIILIIQKYRLGLRRLISRYTGLGFAAAH
jgi:FkbM family methyltransferase